MTRSSNSRRDVFLLAVLLFAQLVLMSASTRRADGATRLESWWITLSSPVVGLGRAVAGAIHRSWDGSRELIAAHGRNAELERDLAALRAEVRQLRESSLENERLRQLLMMREQLTPRSVGAAVVTSELSGPTQLIVVDRGSRHGVRSDLPVVAWGGVVGRVVAVGPRHSKVQLLMDPNSGVAGVAQRTRAQGMVLGQGNGPLQMRYVPRFADVALGDRVVSSGLDGIFPRGLGIGRVRSISRTPDGSLTLQLTPDLDYRSLEEVLILLEKAGGPYLAGPEEGS